MKNRPRSSLMKTGIFFLGLTVFLLSFLTHAATQSWKLDDATIRLNTPSDWQSVKDLYGVPLMILSPEGRKKDRRVTILITPTGKELSTLDSKDSKAAETEYKKGREDWLKKFKGRSLNFYPYQNNLKWKGASEVHSMGYQYQIADEKFSERTYYAICGKQLFHIKTLLTLEQEQRHQSTVDGILRSFQCE